jgi:hypothetical protein
MDTKTAIGPKFVLAAGWFSASRFAIDRDGLFLILEFVNQAPARPPEASRGSLILALTIQKESNMAQRVKLEEVSQPLDDAYDCLLANGLGGTGEALRILVNEASRIECARHLQAMSCELSAQRVDQANGYKSKTMLTRVGKITFEVPQLRTAGFCPSAPERGSRSEQSVNLALADVHVHGRVDSQGHRSAAKAGRPRVQPHLDPDQPLRAQARRGA